MAAQPAVEYESVALPTAADAPAPPAWIVWIFAAASRPYRRAVALESYTYRTTAARIFQTAAARDERLATGRCRECGERAEHGGICYDCRERIAARVNAVRATARTDGRCTSCTVAPARPGRRTCARCAETAAAAGRRYRAGRRRALEAQRAADGLCVRCGERPAERAGKCARCRDLARAAQRAFRERRHADRG